MAALNIQEKDKLLEEPLIDFDFGNECDDKNADANFIK